MEKRKDYDQLFDGTNSLLDCGNLPAKSMGKFSNAITLLHHGRTKVKDDADDILVICGGIDAFLDFEKKFKHPLVLPFTNVNISCYRVKFWCQQQNEEFRFHSIWFI